MTGFSDRCVIHSESPALLLFDFLLLRHMCVRGLMLEARADDAVTYGEQVDGLMGTDGPTMPHIACSGPRTQEMLSRETFFWHQTGPFLLQVTCLSRHLHRWEFLECQLRKYSGTEWGRVEQEGG